MKSRSTMSDSSGSQSTGAGITTSPLLQAPDERTQKVLQYDDARSSRSIGLEVLETPTSSPGRTASQSSQEDFQCDSPASRSQSIPTDTSVTFTTLDLQAPTNNTHSSSQHGDAVIPQVSQSLITCKQCLICCSSRPATKFRFRDLPAEIRCDIYGYVWPCKFQAMALLDTLKHDSKLRIEDLGVATKFFDQHQRYTITAQNYAEFRAMRPLRRMEQITDVTIRIDAGLSPGVIALSSMAGCHCTLRNWFETIKIHTFHDPESELPFEYTGVNLARLLTRAAEHGNGGPTTLIMMMECCEPFRRNDVDRLRRQFVYIDQAIGLPSSCTQESEGKVLKLTWHNATSLRWATAQLSPGSWLRTYGSTSDQHQTASRGPRQTDPTNNWQRVKNFFNGRGWACCFM